MKRSLLVVFLSLALSGCAYADTPVVIDEYQAVKALIGEAGGQSNRELYAHACALKNRWSLRGVYGLEATHTPNPSPEQWQRVSRAWQTALLGGNDVVDGRTEWRSMDDLSTYAALGVTPWSLGLRDPLTVGDTTFYRRRK